MQNILLSELFQRVLPAREPLDPNLKVVKLDKYAELDKFFNEQTEWGRNKARIQEEVRASFGQKI